MHDYPATHRPLTPKADGWCGRVIGSRPDTRDGPLSAIRSHIRWPRECVAGCLMRWTRSTRWYASCTGSAPG